MNKYCRRSARWNAKYELLHTVRTHMGASDANFGCVVQREDSEGKVLSSPPGPTPLLGPLPPPPSAPTPDSAVGVVCPPTSPLLHARQHAELLEYISDGEVRL